MFRDSPPVELYNAYGTTKATETLAQTPSPQPPSQTQTHTAIVIGACNGIASVVSSDDLRSVIVIDNYADDGNSEQIGEDPRIATKGIAGNSPPTQVAEALKEMRDETIPAAEIAELSHSSSEAKASENENEKLRAEFEVSF